MAATTLPLLFCSYAHADESLMKEFQRHLAPLKRSGRIETVWHDRQLLPGSNLNQEILDAIDKADIFLALVSPDFINSDYCFEIETQRALERRDRGELDIVPIILHPVYWEKTALGRFTAMPADGRPIIKFANRMKFGQK